MMKLYRSALVAGVLALGVAACGDDVQVVEPTPPAPPPPPALSASMAPASAEVEVGSSVVFAVNVSGGVAGEASSWSCASSNTGIATVSVTSAGCQATGVAAGGVTITATVSKGNETANVGSQLTVTAPPAPPAFEASIAPESQSVAVGSSVVFAVNTSGGDMMMAASWTCASSDPAIATVETTDAGCQATGVSGGEVTVNVAATDGHDTINLVAQLTVTTDPVDPVQPFSATMAPESATVVVGSDAVFAINTSGGAADATASWTCSSSDEAIATAATTDAGCQATGMAAGGVTINAAVTKGEDSANLAAQLTVTAPDVAAPAFVFITDPTDGTSLEGDVSVKISVERGDQTPMGLSLLVDGEVAAHQSFGMAATPAMDEPAEQAPLNFTLSFDSGEYDKATGAVTYPNGDHTISAELTVAGSENPVPSNNVSVEFDNDDFVRASVGGLGDGAMNEATGQVWHGGPDVTVEITAVPVVYSSGAVSSLTLLSFCGDDSATDSEAPFSFSVDCDGWTSDKDGDGDKPTFTVGGDNITARGGAVYLDFAGPAAPHFQANPNDREDGWVNAAVDFLGEQKSSNKDGWLHYNDDDESGVGGYMPQLRFSSTTPSIVDGARAATPNALPTEPTKVNAVCVIATAVDLLGNESKLPKAGTACASAADYATTTGTGDDATTTYAAGIRAGLDVSAPTIAFTGVSPTNNDRDLQNEFQVQVADTGGSTGKSDLHSDPVLAKVVIRNVKDEMLCGNDDDDGLPGEEKITGECVLHDENGLSVAADRALVTTTGVAAASTIGYYTFTAVARDKAGNRSEEISRVALEDTTPPGAGLIVGAFDSKKSSYSVTVTATDNLSVRDYYLAMVVPAVAGLENSAGGTPELRLPRTAVDAYNDALTQTTSFSGSINAVRAVQATAATGTAGEDAFADLNTVDAGNQGQITSIGVSVRDQSSNPGTAGSDTETGVAATTDIAGFVTRADAEQSTTHFEAFVDEDELEIDDVIELEVLVVGDGEVAVDAVLGDNPATTEVETDFVITPAVPAVPYANPFIRIDFYALASDTPNNYRFIGSQAASTAGVRDTDDADTAVDRRTYIYEAEISAAHVYAAADDNGRGNYGSATATDIAGGQRHIIAIGVRADGLGLVSQPVPIEIDK